MKEIRCKRQSPPQVTEVSGHPWLDPFTPVKLSVSRLRPVPVGDTAPDSAMPCRRHSVWREERPQAVAGWLVSWPEASGVAGTTWHRVGFLFPLLASACLGDWERYALTSVEHAQPHATFCSQFSSRDPTCGLSVLRACQNVCPPLTSRIPDWWRPSGCLTAIPVSLSKLLF